MKPKNPYKVKRVLPRGWWLHPSFDFGLKYPMPYIWFMYWLITWEEVEYTWLDTAFSFRRYIGRNYLGEDRYILVKVFSFIKIDISFMPD